MRYKSMNGIGPLDAIHSCHICRIHVKRLTTSSSRLHTVLKQTTLRHSTSRKTGIDRQRTEGYVACRQEKGICV